MRLIDADRNWSEEASDNTGYRLEYENGMFAVYNDTGTILAEFMPDLPTAYDVDKVVEQIETIMDDESIRYCGQAVQRSVNIVEEGGVNETD